MPDQIWNVLDPMSLLAEELEKRGMEEPEPRLLMMMMIIVMMVVESSSGVNLITWII